jgi:hypothetical protein
MQEHQTDLPKGMRRFNELDLARPFKQRFYAISGAVSAGFILVSFGLYSATDSALLAFPFLLFGLAFVWYFYTSSCMLHVPIAVDLNHPFMDNGEPIGKATVFVRLSPGRWLDVGIGRVRLAEDELVGGCNLVRDNDDYTFIGHFTDLQITHRGIKKQIVLLNQAIALRDAVNGEEDTIEDARVREHKETGLLERSWMEEQTELEFEPDGIMSRLRGE